MINTLNREQISGQKLVSRYEEPFSSSTALSVRLKSTATKIIDVIAAVLPVVFILTVIFLEAGYPQYNRIENTISDLVWSPQGWIMTTAFALFGMLLMSLSLRLYPRVAPGVFSRIGISLIFLMGVGFVIIALFPTKAPGAAQTIRTLLHKQTANSLSVFFPLSCLFIAGSLKNGPEWQLVRVITVLSGGCGLVFALVGAVAVFTGASWIGAIERAIIGNGLIWMEVLGVSLLFPRSVSRIRNLPDLKSDAQPEPLSRLLPDPVMNMVNYAIRKRK